MVALHVVDLDRLGVCVVSEMGHRGVHEDSVI